MGIDIEEFVHPEHISPELICHICQGVLEKPVQTPSEHLFCEDELLEWMTRSDLCPITHEKLDPDTVTKPGRIICNMIGALERYCPNRAIGCTWKGPNERVKEHKKTCQWKSREVLLRENEEKDTLISLLRGKVAYSEKKITQLENDKCDLEYTIQALQKKLNVYEAFFEDADHIADNNNLFDSDRIESMNTSMEEDSQINSNINANGDFKQLRRLRELDSLYPSVAKSYPKGHSGNNNMYASPNK
jgi:hypothetical protein